jgi:hypothetical protein
MTIKTYDAGARTHGSSPTWKSLRDLLRRWIDRERELISLRNAVGMLSEARRADAAEYAQMQEALLRAKDKIHLLQSHLDARSST